MTTTQSPVQEITQTEAISAAKVEKAKKLSHEEVEAFKKEEVDRLEQSKSSLKDAANDELKKEKDSLNAIITDGAAQTQKEVEVLKKDVDKNKAGIISGLVDHFISFFAS